MIDLSVIVFMNKQEAIEYINKHLPNHKIEYINKEWVISGPQINCVITEHEVRDRRLLQE